MARSSKDIAKRLRFDRRPRADLFRRWYFLVGLAACGLGALAWFGFTATAGERQYLPGPLTPAHATFGDRCAHCHVSFASTPDDKCLACHSPRVHAENEVGTPPCRDCHIEHRTATLLVTLSSRECVQCHGDLKSTREPAVSAHIASFTDHPEFLALREGHRDAAAVRFNHQIHLTSDKVTTRKLDCPSCHVASDDGRYMQPIVFETHCKECHALTAADLPSPMGGVAAPHEKPETIRDALRYDLVALGARQADGIFVGNETILIPGRERRGPVDDSKTLQEFSEKWTGKIEAVLYKPFVDQPALLENNKGSCFLCHLQGGGTDPKGFPQVVETKVPARWLARGEFSHRKHDKLPCVSCHPVVEKSHDTADVNLPGHAVCLQCHADGKPQSAGTDCVLCHLYHDTTKHPADRAKATPAASLDKLLGRTP
jgi:hypothetical protein